jgi:DNA repair protein RecN (Recombination protein N)
LIDIPSDPSRRLDEIESRLAYIGGLKRKYGTTVDEILSFAKKASAELESLDNSDERIAELTGVEKELRTSLSQKAQALTESRTVGAARIEEEVAETLRFLDMPKVRFAVCVTPRGAFEESGADNVEFFIAANSGETMKPLSASASGGELSRVMLAIKCSVASADDTETLIFDEVDTGVSGKTSRKIGIKLKGASASAQIFAVTHSAQIASLAHHHLLVSKDDVNGRMETRLEELDYEGRVNETARILGGINVSDSQRFAAIDMISEGVMY